MENTTVSANQKLFEELYKNKPLSTVESDELYEKQIPKRRYVVAELMPEGLMLLFGPPKVGKSFLVLNLCISVAKGEPFLGYPTEKGEVLYFCFEDDEERLQKRLHNMADDGFPGLFFSNEIVRLEDGLINKMGTFLSEHPNLKMIVIDTLSHIRSDKGGGNIYKTEYDDLTPLHEFALKNHVTVVLVHHTRKNAEGDSYDSISGSNGIAAACDDVYQLHRPQRNAKHAKFIMSGRDITPRTIDIAQNEQGVWESLVDAEYKRQQIDPDVLAVFLVASWALVNYSVSEFTPAELSEDIEKILEKSIPANMLKKKLTENHEDLEKLGLHFKNLRSKGCRLLRFEKTENFRYPYFVFDEQGKVVFDLIYDVEEYFGKK